MMESLSFYKAEIAALSPCLRVGSTPVFPSQTVRDLGVTLDVPLHSCGKPYPQQVHAYEAHQRNKAPPR